MRSGVVPRGFAALIVVVGMLAAGAAGAVAVPVASPSSGPTTGGTTVSVPAPSGPVAYSQIAAGQYHSVALATDGTVWAWGLNAYGQLGDGTSTDSSSPVQVQVPVGHTITQVAGGLYLSLALASDGTVWAWGWNNNGQLGNGTTTYSSTPVRVQIPTGHTVTQVSAGASHSVSLASDGTVWAWGLNNGGQLGNGTTANSSTPVLVQTPTGHTVTQVAAGGYHSVALASDGTVWAWGYNGYGELGQVIRESTPTQPVIIPL